MKKKQYLIAKTIKSLKYFLDEGWPTRVYNLGLSKESSANGVKITACTRGHATCVVKCGEEEHRLTLAAGDTVISSAKVRVENERDDYHHLLECTISNSLLRVVEDDSRDYPFHLSTAFQPLRKEWEPAKKLFQFCEALKTYQDCDFGEVMTRDLTRLILAKSAMVLQYSEPPTPARKILPVLQFHQILDHLNQHFYQPVTRQDVARKFNLNPDYINELFKKAIKRNFKDYLTTLRLEHARDLLRVPSLKVKDIAGLCGFNSRENFMLSFSKYYKTTPLKMKRSMSELQARETFYGITMNELNILDVKPETEPTTNVFDWLIVYFVNLSETVIELTRYNDEGQSSVSALEPGRMERLNCRSGTVIPCNNMSSGKKFYFSAEGQQAVAIIR